MVWQPLVDPPVFRVGAWEFLIRSHRFVHALGHASRFSKAVNALVRPVLGPLSWAAALQASSPV